MKRFFIILDGAADRPNKMLNGKTPLEISKTPNIDFFAQNGQQALVEILPKGYVPESDSGIMALLGYDPLKYYRGRGGLECIGLSSYKNYKYFVGFRVNFASLSPTGVLERRTMRGLSQKELVYLSTEINSKVKICSDSRVDFELLSFGSYRGILGIYSKSVELSGNVTNTDPGFQKKGYFSFPIKKYKNEPLICFPLDNSLAAQNTATIVNEFIKKANDVLSASMINKTRIMHGQPVTNCLLLRDGGSKPPSMPSVEEKYKKSVCIYGQLPCERGLADLIGATYKYTDAFELQLDQDYLKKVAVDLVNAPFDIVVCHLKGPDEFGHDNDPSGKVHAIETIDKYFFNTLTKKVSSDDIVVVTCDHATPCELGLHSDDKVPVLICGQNIISDTNVHFDEKSASKNNSKIYKATEILKYVCGLG